MKYKEIEQKDIWTCSICNKLWRNGINVGTGRICRSCIDEISFTNVNEVQYNIYVDKISKITNVDKEV